MSHQHLPAGRLAFGLTLLVAPVRDTWTRRYCRVLGVRQLLESAMLLRPSRRLLRVGAAVDAIHAGAAVAFARRWPSHRWSLLANAVTACAFTAEGLRRERASLGDAR